MLRGEPLSHLPLTGRLVTASDEEREEGLFLCKLSVQSSVIGAYGKHEALVFG